jgi:glycosyltransferase involved in cell wall biosynthesis
VISERWPRKPKTLSLVIPIYNEAKNLADFLTAIDRFNFGLPTELVLVDDGSTDSTTEILHRARFRRKHIILRNDSNRGKGAAIRQGVTAASGDIIGIQDADFEYNFADIRRILAPLKDCRCEVVYGSRFGAGAQHPYPRVHYMANCFLTFLSNVLSGLKVTDMETCYKFFRREILQNIELQSPRFGFEPEITAKIARLNIQLQEVPISYLPRNYFEGKKITWRDGVAAVWHVV